MTLYNQNGFLLDSTNGDAVVVNGLSNPNWPYNFTVLDNFNRANENPIAAPWSGNQVQSGTSGLIVSSNQLAIATTSNGYLSTTTYGPDMGALVTVPTLPPTNNYIAIYLRLTGAGTTGWNGYFLVWTKGATDTYDLRKRVGVTTTGQLGGSTQSSATLVAGDKLGFGVVGSTLTAYKFSSSAWTNVLQVTDTSLTTAGGIGLEMDSTTTRVDDLTGGTK